MQNPIPLHLLLRRRRQELQLKQADIARPFKITPEAVGLWECGRRRMDLDKLPRIADILLLHRSDVCRAAIYEFYPCLYTALFGDHLPGLPRAAGLPDIPCNGQRN